MAGSVSGLHVFQNDVGPEALSLLDNNFSPLATALNTLATYSNYYVDGGAVNALAVTVSAPQQVSYVDGLMLEVTVANTTTSATPTLAVNGLGARTIVHNDNSSLAIGELVAAQRIQVIYDATNNVWRLLSATFAGLTLTATVTINAVAGRQSLVVNSNVSFNAIVVTDGTHSGAIVTSASAGQEFQFGTTSNHALVLYTNSTNRAILSNTGNLTLNAPGSGTTVTINTSAGGIAINQTAANFGIRVQDPGAAGSILELKTTNAVAIVNSNWFTSQTALSLQINSVEAININGSTRGVTIQAPSSGVELTLANGVAGQAVLSAGPTAASSWAQFPLLMTIGHSAGDYPRLGYNFVPTTSAGVYNYSSSDFASAISFISGGLQFLTAASGTAPNPVTFAQAMTIAQGNNVVINAPVSGNALTVNGLTGAQSNGAITAYFITPLTPKISLRTSTDGIDWSLYVNSGSSDELTFRYEQGTTDVFRLTRTPAIQGFGPVNAGLVDMTPDKGSWTTTLSGPWTAGNNVTGTLKWERMGNIVTIWADANITQTCSQSSFITASGLPAAITPTSARSVLCWPVQGPGTDVGQVTVNTNNTLTLNLINTGGGANPQPLSTAAFGPAGTAGILANWSITYSL